MLKSATIICFIFLSIVRPAISGESASVTPDYVKIQKHLEYLAEIGNAEAQFKLAALYYQGHSQTSEKKLAFVWFFLSSEYKYKDADIFAKQVFSELSENDKKQAKIMAKQYLNQFGEIALLNNHFPLLRDEKIASQSYSELTILTEQFKLKDDDNQLVDKMARGRKASAENTAALVANLNEGYRHNAYDNFSKFGLEGTSGLVIMQHQVNKLGNVVDPEVLFSWPVKQFDQVIVKSILKDKYSPALRNGKPAKQFGVVSKRRIGKRGKNSFRTEYPIKYRYFSKMKKESFTNNRSKYIYANLLRAYGDIIGAKQPKSFDELLLELAHENVVAAQHDYAEYLIYQKQDIDHGLYWLMQAVKRGYTPSEYRLGTLLIEPNSVYMEKDVNKGKFWLSRAGDKDFKAAKNKLANL